MKKDYFDNYFKRLKKLEQKRFQKVLDLYPEELRPLTHAKVKKEIENNKKLSDVAKIQMLQFSGFKIGDEVFIDNSNYKRTIAEFIKKPEGDFVIFTDHDIIHPPSMIEMISKEKRKDSNGKPYFYTLKEYSIFDDLNITEITSDVSHMLNEYAVGTYDFNPVYQRDLVWSTDKKQEFVKKLLIGDVDLCPTLLSAPYSETKREGSHPICSRSISCRRSILQRSNFR